MVIFLFLLSYLLGSISTALIIGKVKGVKLREKGTKNPGATNVFKMIGPGWGIFTGSLDFLKGALPTLLVKEVFHFNYIIIALIALGAIIGHNWPVFNKFNGGRGLATTMGTLGIIDFYMALVSFVTGCFLTWVLRKIINRDIRIPYLVYPMFAGLMYLVRGNFILTFYGISIFFIACFRAWQVRNR